MRWPFVAQLLDEVPISLAVQGWDNPPTIHQVGNAGGPVVCARRVVIPLLSLHDLTSIRRAKGAVPNLIRYGEKDSDNFRIKLLACLMCDSLPRL